MPLHSCQAAPLNFCSLVFHQQWPLHCLSQLTPHFLSCEVPPGWRTLQVAGEWTAASQLVCSGCQSAMHTPSPPPLHLTQFASVWSLHVRKCIIDLWVTSSGVERKWFSHTDFEELLQLCVSGSRHCVFWDPQTKLFLFWPSGLFSLPFFLVSSLFRCVLYYINVQCTKYSHSNLIEHIILWKVWVFPLFWLHWGLSLMALL